ncbi:hypothetical protein Scep_015399 [Stephania cephalantha]|uniref:RING-type E3 ubiquitin transferase n=1 Tax=Stephania cephalantha TaxID=152367 RepID=A0AAP0J365_9MAGN
MHHSMTPHLIRSLLHSDPSWTTGSTPPSLITPSTAANPRTMPSRFDASMIAATVVLLSSLFFFSFVYMCVRSRSSSYSSNSFSLIRYRTRGHDLSDSIGPTKRASATSTVGSLRMFVYDVAAAKEPVECAVCLGGLRDKDSVKMIPCCGHVFHQQCIDRWFDRHVSCPLCRSTVLQLLPSVRLKEVERSDPGGSVSRGG